MTQYRKKPTLIEATQWFHNGDHPGDESTPIDSPDGGARVTEGKVVRYFKSLTIPGARACAICGNPMSLHGQLTWTRTGEEELVCPGDYVVTDAKGRFYAMSAKNFEAMYEPYSEER